MIQVPERATTIRQSKPESYIKQRIKQAADGLDRAGNMQARVGLVNEAMAALAILLYKTEADGQPANIDPKTWRILVPAPWGRSGWRHWGLRNWEARILSRILLLRCTLPTLPTLYDYNEVSRTWHLTLDEHPTAEQAIAHLRRHPVELEEWRDHHEQLNREARERMLKVRG